ncbi:aminotransferase class I/II-fold pyridoxal phosphate-dependent enzyme [Candidatus Pelagibacter bacterium]|jgi:aspartate aminotransferase|nr:aminotransferase class I/II-fold pyridoxal phosphate-dependent enzyme [Candidatus Pelagibacter bacterium]MDB2655473.1 aminotransferase class I/II-fold pyridoxal phosphate-dependent enzyme [Candidatus Pelagibacter bacterium]MDB3859206.1 aminotransferase class I/II-fold pyridoxal phosphate-dependent enzyme [Candidatus Pelagibacter sp.]MDC3334265.1 aminotransferase class I/II-fold pyridoxal phosphate-dependent enzyme [Candidatus Pelagibacter sp.]
MLKNLVKDLKPSSTLLINETSRKLEEQGKKIFKFGFGQSPFKVPEDVVRELKNNAHQNKYLPMQGLSELRNAVAKYTSKKKNYDYKSENVIIGPGSKELMFLLHVIFDGEIILPAPSWVSYAPQAILGRNKAQILQTKRENNWFPTASEIEEIVLKDKNKNYLLFLNSPNNPSGQICENLEEIASIAEKYNLIILSDEIYSELSFMNNYQSISNFCPKKTIISTGLSKWCGAGGWRLGYFLVPDSLTEIKNMINVLASETFSAVSAPIQYAAIKAYEQDHSNYINKSKNILGAIGNYVYENLRSNKVLINKPQGGFYLMPEFLNKKFNSSSEMCDSILNDTGVALLPGSDFGFEQTKMLARLSFTDFDGQEFMNKIEDNQKIDNDEINKFAPKIVEGVDKLKKWSESI